MPFWYSLYCVVFKLNTFRPVQYHLSPVLYNSWKVAKHWGVDWFRAKGSWRCQRSGVEGNKKTRHDDNKLPSGGVGDTTRSQWNRASRQREKRDKWLSFESSTSSVVRPEEGWAWELLFFVPVQQEPARPSRTIMCHISCCMGWQSFRWMARSAEQR